MRSRARCRALNFPDGDANPDLDGNRIHFVGISLGSIISGVFLGVDTDVVTATLSSPAGPWTSILTDPQAIDFGGPIRAALSAQGLPPGTVGFDNFVRDLQTVIDPVDPINYAADAAANHPLHVIEVLGDTAVPNGPTDYIAQLWGLPSGQHDDGGGAARNRQRHRALPRRRALVVVQSGAERRRDDRDAAPDGDLRRDAPAASFRSPTASVVN